MRVQNGTPNPECFHEQASSGRADRAPSRVACSDFLDHINLPQIIHALYLWRAFYKITCTGKHSEDKLSIWRAARTQSIAPSAKCSDWSSDLCDQPLTCVVTIIILIVLDINRLKLCFCLRDGRKEKKRTIIFFERDDHMA
jgi:hypothetical protein